MDINDKQYYPKCMVSYYFGKFRNRLNNKKLPSNEIIPTATKFADIIMEYKLKYNENLYGEINTCPVTKETFEVICNEYEKRHLNDIIYSFKETIPDENVFRKFYVFGAFDKNDIDNNVFNNYHKAGLIKIDIPFLNDAFELHIHNNNIDIEEYIKTFSYHEIVYMLYFLMRKIIYHKGYMQKSIFKYVETLCDIIYYKLRKINASAILDSKIKLFYNVTIWEYLARCRYELNDKEKEALIFNVSKISDLII